MKVKNFVVSGVLCMLAAVLALWTAQSRATTWNVPAGSLKPIIASSGNVAANTATCTLTNTSTTQLLYLEGFDITSNGATAVSGVTVTVTGSGATQSYTYTTIATLSAGPVGGLMSIRFPSPIPASGTNTNFVISMPSLGSGNTLTTIVGYGYIQ